VLINRSQWGKRLHAPGLRWVSCRNLARLCPPEIFSIDPRIPIQIVVGDNIPSSPQPIPQLETPRIRLIFRSSLSKRMNHYGATHRCATARCRIYGNTHAPFLDLNNLEVADLDVRVPFMRRALIIESIDARPETVPLPSSARLRRLRRLSALRAQQRLPSSAVSQFPTRTPSLRTPFTRRMPARGQG